MINSVFWLFDSNKQTTFFTYHLLIGFSPNFSNTLLT